MRKSLGIPIAVLVATICGVLIVANAPNGLDGIAMFIPGALALIVGVPVFLWAYAALLAALLDRRPIRAGVDSWAGWVVGLVVALCLSALGVVFLGLTSMDARRIARMGRSELLFATAVLAMGVAGLTSLVVSVLPRRAARKAGR